MRVLITGGAGFIGSHLADRLMARDDDILVIDNFATGRRDNLTAGGNLKLIEGTIADTDLVDQAFEEFRPDVVVHAAASYKDPEAWVEDVQTNIAGTVNITRASQRVRVNRLIYFQTALCYGITPIEQPITLNHPIRPEGSSYAYSKTAGEQYIAMTDLNYISFRLANAYGPRNMSGPLPTFYHRLTAGKPCFVMDTRRDFIYVDDLIDVVMKAIGGEGERGAYHVSSGSDFAIKELFDATIRALDIQLDEEVEVRERSPDDTYTILLDPSQTKQDFGWETSTLLEVGVQRAIDYYRQYGISETYTHLRGAKEPETAEV